MSILIAAAICVLVTGSHAGTVMAGHVDRARFWAGCAAADALGALVAMWVAAAGTSSVAASIEAGLWASAGISLLLWWLSRRKRKDRARRWLGAKSRALRDALARKARELSVPRPVLAPGGAR